MIYIDPNVNINDTVRIFIPADKENASVQDKVPNDQNTEYAYPSKTNRYCCNDC